MSYVFCDSISVPESPEPAGHLPEGGGQPAVDTTAGLTLSPQADAMLRAEKRLIVNASTNPYATNHSQMVDERTPIPPPRPYASTPRHDCAANDPVMLQANRALQRAKDFAAAHPSQLRVPPLPQPVLPLVPSPPPPDSATTLVPEVSDVVEPIVQARDILLAQVCILLYVHVIMLPYT
jgi:hypothetical protein